MLSSMTNFHLGMDFTSLSQASMKQWGILLAALCCAVLPLEISHLVSALVGAAGYLLLQSLQPSVARKQPKAHKGGSSPKVVGSGRACLDAPSGHGRDAARQGKVGAWTPSFRNGSSREVAAAPRVPEVRKPSVAPVSAPTFDAVGWDAEVEELVDRIMPTPQGDAVVEEIAEKVHKAIRVAMPEAEVAGYATANILGRSAFGVAVPEVDIVVTVAASALQGRLHGRWSDNRSSVGRLDSRKLQKSAIRVCTDRLVGTGGFKFRRSAFRGCEPKVTLIAPAPASSDPEAPGVPVNLSVNAVTPLYSTTLLNECGKMEPRAKALILIVKRWAKDRGVSHAAKGHLSPYTWSLLTIYFLQVAEREEGPLLPPLDGHRCAGGLAMRSQGGKAGAALPTKDAPKKSVGRLFTDFIKFYATEFDWRKEGVSVLTGRRLPPDVSLPLHIVLHDDAKTTEVGPSVEDPFELSTNLGACTTQGSLVRLREELQRALRLSSQGACLTELLEPWAPADVSGAAEEEE